MAIKLVFNLIVCYEKDNPLGFIGANNTKLEMLFVDNNLRGKDSGSKLLDYAFNNYNINEVVVNEENKEAHKFYLKHGFYDYKREDLDEQGNPYPIKINCKKDYNEKQIEAWLKELIKKNKLKYLNLIIL